jgi:DNA excision repair protein ERCC-8
LQIDGSEARYLLAGASDGSVGVYDTQQATTFDSITHTAKHEALFTVDKSVPQGHMYSVSSVQWYPVDTGLFVTGSFDNNINLWDTNTLQVPRKSSSSSSSLPLFLLSKEKTLVPRQLFSQ